MTLVSGVVLPVEGIAGICRRYGVQELSVFGSEVRGGMRPDSDIDILVVFEPDARIGLVKFASFSEELESLRPQGRRGHKARPEDMGAAARSQRSSTRLCGVMPRS